MRKYLRRGKESKNRQEIPCPNCVSHAPFGGHPWHGSPSLPSDLSDEEWVALAPLLPPAKSRGRPRSVDLRRIVKGIFFVLRSGCTWRYLPREYGPWQTVYWYFSQWRRDGTWAQIHARLRELARLHAGRDHTPSGAILDSQSIKTLMGGVRGFDGAKKIAGRKRHILVDAEGFLLAVVVHPANVPDRQGGRLVLDAMGERFPRLRRFGRTKATPGRCSGGRPRSTASRSKWCNPHWRQLRRYAPALAADLGYGAGYHVLPRQWVVERTFSWLGRQRRLSKDYERLTSTAEALIYLVGIRLLLARLAPS